MKGNGEEYEEVWDLVMDAYKYEIGAIKYRDQKNYVGLDLGN